MRRLLKKIFLLYPNKKVDWNFELRLRQFNFYQLLGNYTIIINTKIYDKH